MILLLIQQPSLVLIRPRHFDQLKVGDIVKATQTEELAVSLRKSGAPPSASESTQVVLAPRGAKPGLFMTKAREVTAKVQKVELKAQKVTLQFLDGKTKTFKVGQTANLSDVHPGDEVVVSLTESVTIRVDKP